MRFTIKLKLAIAFGFMIVLLVGSATYGIMSLNTLNDAIGDIVTGPAKRLEKAQDLGNIELKLVRAQMNMATATTPEDIGKYIQASDANRKNFSDTINWLLSVASTDAGKKGWTDISDMAAQYFAFDDKMRALVADGHSAEAIRQITGAGRDMIDAMEKAMDARIDANRQQMTQADSDTDVLYANTRNFIIAITVAAFLCAVIAAAWIAFGINRGLKKIAAVAHAVAIGDLNQTVEIKSKDEIKDLVDTINVMTANLRKTAEVADQIASGDLTVSPKPLSDKDVLGIALEQMVERLRGVVTDAITAAENVSSGSQQLSSSSEQVSRARPNRQHRQKKLPLRWSR